ncbi:MAG: magnesium transporter CorA family protein [Bacillota bacterium]
MITISKLDENNQIDTVQDIEIGCWIHLAYPTNEELNRVARETKIPKDMLMVALDPEESAHIDVEEEAKLAVVDMPIIEKEDGVNVFSTSPIGFCFNKGYFVSVATKESSIIKDILSNRVRNIDPSKKVRFMLQIINRIEFKYLQYLKRMDKMSLAIQRELERSVKNKELIELLDIEKSLVYFSTSLTANDRVLYKIRRSPDFKKYEEDQDLLEDVITENAQAIEMCSIYRDILSGTMDAYASVISNNLNIIMKLLAIFTITLTVPTVISGLWGMNLEVPFAGTSYGFYLIIAVVIVSTILISGFAVVLSRPGKGSGRRKSRKKK